MNKTSNEIKQSISEYLATFEQDVVPKGWYSIKQISEKHRTTKRNVLNIVNKLIKYKQAERKVFRVSTENGLHKVPHYKLSAAAAKAFGF